MWIYTQPTGELCRQVDPDPAFHVSFGYSGSDNKAGEKGPVGKNNSRLENIRDVGPIPCGRYRIEAPRRVEGKGDFVMPLTPDEATASKLAVMGWRDADNKFHPLPRGGFSMHGDSIKFPGTASKGCPIFTRVIREKIWTSGDRDFVVQGDSDQYSEQYD